LPYFLLTLFVLIIDQLLKVVVVSKLNVFENVWIIKNIFSITLVYNYGAAFGILQSQTLLLIILSLAVILFVWINRKKLAGYPTLFQIGLALALGGAFGNLVDRIRLGYVIDFLDFQVWPVFNLADIAIVAGVGLVIIGLYSDKSETWKKFNEEPAKAAGLSVGKEDLK